MKKRALWVAPDSRKFEIDFDSQEDLMQKIADLREKHDYPKPDAIHAIALQPGVEQIFHGPGVMDTADLSEHEEREIVKNSLSNIAKPDPKQLN